jgi:hypothetical protein
MKKPDLSAKASPKPTAIAAKNRKKTPAGS